MPIPATLKYNRPANGVAPGLAFGRTEGHSSTCLDSKTGQNLTLFNFGNSPAIDTQERASFSQTSTSQPIRGILIRSLRRPESPTHLFTVLETGDLTMDYRVRAGEIPEDQTTAMMESYSAKLPTSFFLGAALTSIVGSLLLKTTGKDHHALFIGQWAAPFLLLGIYNKMVKQHGSDAHVNEEPRIVA